MNFVYGITTLYLAVSMMLLASFTPPVQAQGLRGCPAGQSLRFYVEARNQYQPEAVGTLIAGLDEVNNAAGAATPPGSACPGGDPDDEWIVGSNFTGRNDTLPLSGAEIPVGYELQYVSQCFSFVDGAQWGPSARHVPFIRGAWRTVCKSDELYILRAMQNAEQRCDSAKVAAVEFDAWFGGSLGLPTWDIGSADPAGSTCLETPQGCFC